ncbi:HEAT repeat protein [Paenibacillus cellulosilyticus]|uniref:HEAT repeat protein n=1 Tax=Paenibacillus cellulosilyticus TaxID=375489 RepID=A0A2V2YVI5_9BACL|nr:HEAT repeat domain-containing protein [Paenibacillus cellulosilyticus]PWW05237.1 HEAT repeat protein [Paenibacillus cellulosilyticus]QKS43561.1 HEAT repeat domain-containing protein [Paenibacillus cellulosilyticus]
MTNHEPIRLTDEQMRTFVTEGFLILQTDFPVSFHEAMTQELHRVYTEEGNPGNNLLPRIREIQQVFDHPIITGALTSVLGPNYMLHAHRHGHYNAQPTAGGWHKDSYWGYNKMRHHHPWWAMIMYFPQDTPIELGPTGILPGTQNYETRTFEADEIEGEGYASGQAGTFALIHYDIWHRATANMLGKPRYMLKFEFMRTAAPTEPSWNCSELQWREPAKATLPIARHEAMWEDTWNWLTGRVGSLAGTAVANEERITQLSAELRDANEPAALNATYELARYGVEGIAALLNGLHDASTAVSRVSAYGLAAAGADAVSWLSAALDDERDETVQHAAFALGELGGLAGQAADKLSSLLSHRSPAVRSAVVESLGMIGGASALAKPQVDLAVSALIRALQDADVQTRFMAGLALSRIGRDAAAAVPALAATLDDENRYVRAHALEALRYIGTEEAKDVLIHSLFQARWCTTTTPANTFYP